MENKSEPKLKILVACHKSDPNIRQDEIYMPIHVGKALHPDVNLEFQADNEGTNISDKNNSYCELTGLYWAWKNLKNVDYIGLCHYRRYFDFERKIHFRDFILGKTGEKYSSLAVDKVLKKFNNKDVILTKERVYPYSLSLDYRASHVGPDLKTLNSVISEYDKDMGVAWEEYMSHTNRLGHYNMFITSWSIFDKYCNWLFEILGRVENLTNIEHYDQVQARIYGYMSERMLPFWMHYNGYTIQRYPIVWYNDNYKRRSRIKDIYYTMRNTIIARLMKCDDRFFKKSIRYKFLLSDS